MKTLEKTGTCSVCGTATRSMFIKGGGNKARAQRSRWHVCERGHKLYRKRGQ